MTKSRIVALAAMTATLLWPSLAKPSATQAATAYFSSIDCRVGTACIATTLFKVWRSTDWGTRWTVVLNAPPNGAVNGVACSASVCVAYGGYGSSIAQTSGRLAWSSDTGANFAPPVTVDDPVEAAACYGLTCTVLARPDEYRATDESVIRVSASGPLRTYTYAGLDGADLEGTDLSCATTTTCVAVGRGADQIQRFDFSGISATYGTYCKLFAACHTLAPKAVECVSSTCVEVGWNGFTDRWVGTRIIVSRTAGRSWTTKATYKTTNVLDVSCVSAKVCVGVGGTGVVVRTVDAGTTWRLVQSGVRSWLISVSCISSGRCLAVADDGVVRYSGNSGATWAARPRFTGLATS